jgi:cytochrome c biogenesis protein CcmG/thiol:disulfide interchange protein DsbE
MSKQWFAVGLVVMVMGTAAAMMIRFTPGSPVAVGQRAPDFRLVALSTGDSISLREEYAGSVTLVNIWATWCAPCRLEMPSMQVAFADLEQRGFRIAAVSIDDGDSESVIAFGEELGLTFDLLHDQSMAIQRDYQTTGVPESFLLDKKGVIVKRVIGWHDWSAPANRGLIERLLEEPAS